MAGAQVGSKLLLGSFPCPFAIGCRGERGVSYSGKICKYAVISLWSRLQLSIL